MREQGRRSRWAHTLPIITERFARRGLIAIAMLGLALGITASIAGARNAARAEVIKARVASRSQPVFRASRSARAEPSCSSVETPASANWFRRCGPMPGRNFSLNGCANAAPLSAQGAECVGAYPTRPRRTPVRHLHDTRPAPDQRRQFGATTSTMPVGSPRSSWCAWRSSRPATGSRPQTNDCARTCEDLGVELKGALGARDNVHRRIRGSASGPTPDLVVHVEVVARAGRGQIHATSPTPSARIRSARS